MKKKYPLPLSENFNQIKKHSLSYSLKRDLRSISKITFCANLSVRPIDIEL